MLMVIFGAGASYDSVPAFPAGVNPGSSRPPLAKDLFALTGLNMEAMEQFPQCQAIMPDLQNPSNNETIEQILQRFQDEDHPLRRRQLAAVRFYLQFMISRCQEGWRAAARAGTNYQVLLSELELMRTPEEQVCLVTFNYDTMLEDAMTSTLGIAIRNLANYIDGRHYNVIKPHGSVNWARLVSTPVGGNTTARDLAWGVIDRVDQLRISREYTITAACPPGRSGDTALFPAIAIPVERKSTYECPDDHVEVLKRCIPQVSDLLIIGWRATEEHFLSLLGESLPNARVHVVAGSKNDVDEIVDRLRRAGVHAEVKGATVEGFTHFTQHNRLRDFLRS